MQLMQKNISQSEALKNLVGNKPVKERQTISQANSIPAFKERKAVVSDCLHNARLDLEIGMYWMLSKYQQTRYRRQYSIQN